MLLLSIYNYYYQYIILSIFTKILLYLLLGNFSYVILYIAFYINAVNAFYLENMLQKI